jgi:hypothetical protein
LRRWAGVCIALATGLSGVTLGRILRRLRLNRIRDIDPLPRVIRYEHD